MPGTIRTTSPYPMLSVAEATREILSRVEPLPPVRLDFRTVAGLVLAEDVLADDDLPPTRRAGVDGYAVVARPGPLRLRVVGEVTAGNASSVTVEPDTAVRIMTGGVLPHGADAVVMFEDTGGEQDGYVEVVRPPRLGDHIQAAGVDARSGQVVLRAGQQLHSPEIGMLAAVGHTAVSVHPRPRVAVLATGDEVVAPDGTPPPGFVRDSNQYALIAAAEEAGGQVVWSGHCVDDPARLRVAVEAALGVADVLITSGGVSMGTRDLLKPLLADLGEIHFGRVAFKPGKPLTFATVQRTAVFALPGFPVSSLVTFEVFVRPALRRLQGLTRLHRPRVTVELEHPIEASRYRLEYQRAVVRWQYGRLIGTATGRQASSRLLNMIGANALLEIPSGGEILPAGARVTALLTGEIEDAPAQG
ncbi:MAG: molybdopterin molybdotransferase MoeA [Chloroflexi bacterium]|nr:molybdopterin molybdotransferase MoeA [Chloroflexota bacterium]